MADTTFVSGTTITSDWLNDVNDFIYNGTTSISCTGLTSRVTAGGSTFALSGDNNNQVTINATPTVIVADNAHTFFWLVRDNTSGGVACGIYDTTSGVTVLNNSITATVVFTATAAGLKAATTAGTVTRSLIVLAIRV